jgi:hypothetical protein
MTSNVTPLFSPSLASYYKDAQFIANIGDEISLWRIFPGRGALRVYPANLWGLWVDGSLRGRLENDAQSPLIQQVKRHIDVIEVYAAMLEERVT